ncbi:MAG: DUF4189 domain-containing protein [Reyranella sp.]|nr:DUF4189 domain-containing protein [Reyranella sp.]
MRPLYLAASAVILVAGTAAAQTSSTSPQSRTWVAYAYDTASGAWGLGWGKADRQATIDDALSRCSRAECKAGTAVLARCIAAAQGTQKGVGFGSGNDAETAKGHALRFCQRGGAGSTCEVLAVRCG